MSRRKTRRTPDKRPRPRQKRAAAAAPSAPPAKVDAAALLPLLSLRDFAALVDRSPDTVSRWCAAGMPHEQLGKANAGFAIELAKALPWVVTYALEPPKESQRERLAREQADRLALENAARRGELIDAQLHGEILKTFASTASQLMDAVASRCSNEIAAISDPAEVHARLKDEHRGIRRTMASIVGEFADMLVASAGSAEAVSAATESDGGSVGRPEAGAPEGLSGTRPISKPADTVHGANRAGGLQPAP